MKSSLASLVLTGLFSAFVMGGGESAHAQSGSRSPSPTRPQATASHTLALRGYCPVCVIGSSAWMPGRPDITSVYDGFVYRFPSGEQKAMFDASPDRFATVLNGDSIVSYVKAHKRVPGKLEYALIHDGRLFLFTSEEERLAFQKAPSTFVNADLAFDGQCAVCRVAKQESVPGKPEFATRYKGLRYYFVDAGTRQMFLANPEKFAVPVTEGPDPRSSEGGSASR